jgi:anaerobic dimethyl sulfoxide reductase subunit A
MNGQFTRITWDQALNTIAAEITHVVNTYGPYSIFGGSGGYTGSPALATSVGAVGHSVVLGYMGQNSCVLTWGSASTGNETLAEYQIYGGQGGGGELGNILNAKLIVLWGTDPAETGGIPWQTSAYYVALAHEQGIPVIAINPRECMSAEILADQWIPIKPGTDIAMLLAVANVLFKQGLYDQNFVSKIVEPTGFAKWQSYVLGQTAGPDGAIDRTPAWAAPICGVPAATIQAFAQLYGSFQGHANGNPCFMWFAQGAARKYKGENPVRAAAYLQLMTGNVGISGGSTTFRDQGNFTSGHSFPSMNYNRTAVTSMPGAVASQFTYPALIKEWKWADSILLRPQVTSGQMSLAAYNAIIGSASTNPAPNIKFTINWGGENQTAANLPVSGPLNVAKSLQAIAQMEMYVCGAWRWTPSAKAADIVLPWADYYEGLYMGFSGVNSGLGIGITPNVLAYQGEARPIEWVRSELANRLGFGQYYNPYYVGKTISDWETVAQQALQNGYNIWNTAATQAAWPIPIPPLSQLQSQGFLLAPSTTVTTTGVPLGSVISGVLAGTTKVVPGTTPFPTASGLAEFYSNTFAAPTLPQTKYGGPVDPMAIYSVQPYGPDDPNQPLYPLALIENHPQARNNLGCNDNNPLYGNNEIMRHSVWMNVSDAQARGIVDNDMVSVYNDLGTMVLPAYVTSRIVPGTVHIMAGAYYTPDANGVDHRGSTAVVLHDDYAPIMEPANGRVQVKLFSAGTA